MDKNEKRRPSMSAWRCAPSRDAQADDRVQILKKNSGDVPVAIDTTGWLRHGVALRYEAEPHGAIRPTTVLVGREARVEDVFKHRDLVDRARRYNEEVDGLHELWRRVGTLLREQPQPHSDGAELSVSHRALSKFEELLATRRKARMGNGFATPEVLATEIRFLEQLRLEHEMAVSRAERAMRLLK
jgi:hypothetical protein